MKLTLITRVNAEKLNYKKIILLLFTVIFLLPVHAAEEQKDKLEHDPESSLLLHKTCAKLPLGHLLLKGSEPPVYYCTKTKKMIKNAYKDFEELKPEIRRLVLKGADSKIFFDAKKNDLSPLSFMLHSNSLLCLAVQDNDIEFTRLLLEHGALKYNAFEIPEDSHFSYNSHGYDRLSYSSYPLCNAIDVPMVELLRSYGADPFRKQKNGWNPLFSATSKYAPTRLLEHYLSIGLNPNEALHKSKQTSLHVLMVSFGRFVNLIPDSMVAKTLALLQSNANLDAEDSNGKTPRDLAETVKVGAPNYDRSYYSDVVKDMERSVMSQRQRLQKIYVLLHQHIGESTPNRNIAEYLKPSKSFRFKPSHKFLDDQQKV